MSNSFPDLNLELSDEERLMRQNEKFLEGLELFMNHVYMTAQNGGWHGDETFGDKMALIHSEISEALEEFRNGRGFGEIYYTYKGAHGETVKTDDMYREVNGEVIMNKPEGIAVELADAIIRILDWSAWQDSPILEALVIKAQYNETRAYRHGGKVI